MECGQTMHENSIFCCVSHTCRINLIRAQLTDTAFPYFIGFAHGYPYVGINNLCIFCCFHHIFFQSNGCSGFCSDGTAGCYQFFIGEICFRCACCKMHTQFCTGYHERVAHIITSIAHVNKFHTLQIAQMFTNGQHISDHLCRMEFIGQTIPYRNTCMFCQFFYDFLTVTTVFNTIIHSSQYAGSICDTFLFTNLGTTGIQISTSHTQIISSYFK